MMRSDTDKAWCQTLREICDRGLIGNGTMREVFGHVISVPIESPVITVAQRMQSSGYKSLFRDAVTSLSMGPFDYIRQVTGVAELLIQDPMTLKAMMGIWRERPDQSNDIPCMVSLQWFIRKGTLHCMSMMPLSDAWQSLPYDLHAFSAMTMHLALVLRKHSGVTVELGWLWNMAGSRFIYEKDIEAVTACRQPSEPMFEYAPMQLSEFASPENLIEHYLWLTQGNDGDGWLTEAYR